MELTCFYTKKSDILVLSLYIVLTMEAQWRGYVCPDCYETWSRQSML